MNTRYAPNLTKATAGIPLLDKDDVEFNIGDVKTFFRTKTDPQSQENSDVFGVQYAITLVKTAGANEKYIGKTFPLQLYMHSENAFGIVKRFVMAALGFSLDDEEKFNEKYADADWSYGEPDKEGNTVPDGSIWNQLKGSRVAATTDIVPNRQRPDQKNQRYDWRPI